MMKTAEENISEGFEEVVSNQVKNEQPPERGSNRPDIRIVQTEVDREGKTIYKNVGGMWKNVSKSGSEYYTIMIGNLKLLAFHNTNK